MNVRFPRILGIAVSVLFVFCCADGDSDNDGDDNCSDSQVETTRVPQLADGVLSIGSSIAFPPIDFYDGDGNPSGLDLELVDAISEHLCVSVEVNDIPFEDLIDEVGARQFDAIFSAMTITDERSERVDFIPYANVGSSIVVRSGNPPGILATADLCGKTVAVQSGTIHEDFVVDHNISCEVAADVLTFEVSAEAVRDVVTAGSEATLTDFPAAFVVAEGDPRLELVDVQICPKPYGIGVRKGDDKLATAISEALRRVDESGVYDELMKKWGLGQARIDLSSVSQQAVATDDECGSIGA